LVKHQTTCKSKIMWIWATLLRVTPVQTSQLSWRKLWWCQSVDAKLPQSTGRPPTASSSPLTQVIPVASTWPCSRWSPPSWEPPMSPLKTSTKLSQELSPLWVPLTS
jgi:hypothetical protein